MKVRLKKGVNVIRISNEEGYAPDIDCITLAR